MSISMSSRTQISSRNLSSRKRAFLARSIAALLVGGGMLTPIATTAIHAGQTWDGGGADNNLTTVNNWDSNVIANFANAINFVGGVRLTPFNDRAAASTLGGINFNNTTGNAFTFSGNSLTLGGNITTAANTAGSTITDEINLEMILNANRTITTNQLSDSIQHNLTVSGVISETGGARSLIKAGRGVLNLTGVNTYTGATTINAGTLNLGNGTTDGSLASATLTLSGGAFNYTRTGSTTQAFTTTNINGGGNLQLSVVSGNTLDLGTVVRGTGGSFNFASTGGGTLAALAASNDASGIMPGFTHGDSWAVANGAGVAISALGNALYTLSSVAGTSAAAYLGNIDVDNSAGLIDGPITANSLRFSSAAANTMTLAAGTNTLTSGGILVGSGVGSNLSTITGGELIGAASKDLNITQNNTSGGLTISSIIANNTAATALTKSGNGLLTLDGNNTFTGGVFINAGTVALGNAGALNSTTANAVTFGAGSNGTLRLGGNSVVISNLSTNTTLAPGLATVENAGATNVTLTVGNASNLSGTFAGIIQDGSGGGTLALTKAGTGTLTLSGANSYTGGTTLTAGGVSVSNPTAFGTGNVVVTGASKITVSGVGNPTYANNIDVGAALTLQIPNATPGTVTYSGQLTGSSNIVVEATLANGITGTHAFTNTNNTFTGSILMPIGTTGTGSGNDFVNFNSIGDGGTFTFRKRGHTNGIVYTGTTPITFATRQLAVSADFGGIFDGGGVNPVNRFLNNATDPANTVTFNSNLTPGNIFQAGTFFFAGSNTGNNTFNGTISNPANFNLGIGKADAGRWILTSTNSSYLGNVLIANGTLSVPMIAPVANTQPLGQSPFIQLGNSGTSGTLEFTGSTNSSTDKQFILGNPTNNNQAGAGGIANNGTGTLTFANATFNSTTGVTVTTVTRTLTLGGSNTGANTIQGVIQNNATAAAVAVTKADAGTWTLDGANTYTGNTTTNGGLLNITNAANTTKGVFIINAGSILNLASFSDYGVPSAMGDRPQTSETTSATNSATSGIGILIRGGTLQYTGSTPQSTNRMIRILNSTTNTIDASGTGAGTLTFTGAVPQLNLFDTGGTRTLNLVGSNTGNNTFGIALTDQATNATSLTKGGLGTWLLTGANTHTGTTTVNTGTLNVGTGGTLGASTVKLAVNNPNTGTGTNVVLNLATAVDTTVGSLSGTIAVPLSGTNTATINNGGLGTNFTVDQTTAGTYAGVIAGAGNFTLGSLSTNTLTLTGANTYTGTTTVNAGKLLINGNNSAATGAVTVNALATLGGSGTIGGTTTVASTGIVAPGNSTGNLTFAAGTDFSAGGVYSWELGALSVANPGIDFDTITVSGGNLALGGTSALTLDFNLISGTDPNSADTFWTTGKSWKIIDVTGGTNTGSTNLSTITNATYTSGSFTTTVGTGGDLGDIFLVFTPTPAGPPVWQGADNDPWTAAASWTGGVVPNSVTAEAKFITTGGTTAVLDANQTINKLTFDATAPHTISGGFTLSLAGTTPTISLAGTNTATQTVAVNLDLAAGTAVSVQGGTLELNSPANAVLGAGVTATVASGATLSLGGAGNALSNGTSTHANVANSGTLLATTAGKRVGEISGSGTTTVTAAGATLTANHIRQSTLNIGAGNTVTVATNGGNSGTSVVTNLNINATGKLDLNDNDLIVDNGNLATLTAKLATGLDINGTYGNGPGITSTAFATNPNFNTVLGIAANVELGYTSFSGQTVDANDILIKYTYYGDADLSGSVDTSTDFDLYITGLTSGGSLGGWLFGDFDYSGTVDSSTDFDLYITGLTTQGGALLTAGGGGNLVQAVPEPSTFVLGGLALLGFAGVGLRKRRQSA